MLYACDADWWRIHHGAPQFAGLKLAHDARACRQFPDVAQIHIERRVDRILTSERGVIGDGGNSGFQAINLAVQFGVRAIVLVGFDMRLDLGAHWHGKHPPGLNNPGAENLRRWRASIDAAAPELDRLGVKVFNASPISALEAFPKVSIFEALAC